MITFISLIGYFLHSFVQIDICINNLSKEVSQPKKWIIESSNSKMDKKGRKKLKEKIISLIEECEIAIQLMDESTKPITPENSIGRLSRMDAINSKGVADAAKSNKKKRLAQLKVALSKIEDPQFGNCANCGNTIQEARLMYMPESVYCVRCASRH